MIVFIHDLQPTGMGVSLSGAEAFYINASHSGNWHDVESHPEFQRLAPKIQETVKAKFPRSLRYYQVIKAVRFF